jgi:high-affinity nickel-transport protein
MVLVDWNDAYAVSQGSIMLIPNPFDDEPAQARAKVGLTYAILILSNVVAWGWAGIAFFDRPTLLGTAFLAYTLGLRHAFDADHIAAIDNVVRKLKQEGKSPYSAGFFFSLGHSTVVIIACIVVAAAASTLNGRLGAVRDIGGIVGTVVSASFLLIIGIANLVILFGTWSVYRSFKRQANIAPENIDALLGGQGFLARLFRPMFRVVTRSQHMYPIGFLFGLGFDTATEIGMLGIAAVQAAQNMPLWTILVFPALFTAGMSLMDTTDSLLMTGAYGWAFVTPIRKLWYNLTITAASVGIALFVGSVEALDLIGRKLGLEGMLWRIVGTLNDNLAQFGFVIVGIFITTWIVSMAVYRLKNYETKPVEQP